MGVATKLFVAVLAMTVLPTKAYVIESMTSVWQDWRKSPAGGEGWINPETDATVCGDKLCWCLEDSANCSSHALGLQYIPELPDNVTRLNFSFNHLKGIYTDDFFTNVTNLTYLSLYGNEVSYISPGAFEIFWQLYNLNMDYNAISYATLHPVLNVSTLAALSLTHCDLGAVPEDLFGKGTLPKLHTLLLHDNRIGNTKLGVFKYLTALEELGLANNKISLLEVDMVSRLDTLNLNTNVLYDFPQTCHSGNASLFPELTRLMLRKNMISSVGKVCLPRLKVLELSQNSFSIIPSNAFSEENFPNLIELYMYSMTTQYVNLAKDAFRNPTLQRISLTSNRINFKRVDRNCFADCPNLEDVQLSHNFLSVTEDRFLELFGNVKSVLYLFIEACEISNITRRMFSGFPRLKILSLDRNSVSVVPDGVFDGLKMLRTLILSSNQISVVSSSMFGTDTRHRLKSLDLSDNPFSCTCEILWFQGWYRANRSLFSRSWGYYNCFNIPGTKIEQFVLDKQACLLSHGASVLIIVSVSLVLLTMTVICVVFRYRWHFRLVLYEAFRGRGDARIQRLAAGRFDYDVFVSYDSDDLSWVRQHLMPELEGRLGLRLCVHERDFTIGRDIVGNIADSVERSKKMMMVFSNNFLQSQWCQFELTLCLRHVMDYDDALIIVCLDDVPSRDLTAPMMAVLKTTTYIQWMDDDDAIASFWGRLHVALREILQPNDP